MVKTITHPAQNPSTRLWHLVDAKGQVLGRLASNVTKALVGKNKRHYSPSADCGDNVVIINAAGIKITGNSKPDQKMDFRHSGYPGGDTQTPYRTFLKEKPDRAIYLAVKGMLPKNRLRSRQLSRLKVFVGSDHPHGAHFVVKAAKPQGDVK